MPKLLARHSQPLAHPQRAECREGRRLELLARLRKRALGDRPREPRAARECVEELIEADLSRSPANHLEHECDDHVERQYTIASEVNGTRPVLRDEFRPVNLAKNILENLA